MPLAGHGPRHLRQIVSNPYSLPADDPAGPFALRTVELAKAFGPTQAVRSCTFDLRVGEVHAIMGENGSGKSTLVKMLTGVHRPDRGTIEVAGRELTGIRSPREALDLGIVTVFQEVLVVPPRKKAISIRVDEDVLDYFKQQGSGYQRRMNAVLRSYMDQTSGPKKREKRA